MVEYARPELHGYRIFSASPGQFRKVFFRAEIRIDFEIIGGVVTMIGGRLKNRIQINCRNMQTA